MRAHSWYLSIGVRTGNLQLDVHIQRVKARLATKQAAPLPDGPLVSGARDRLTCSAKRAVPQACCIAWD